MKYIASPCFSQKGRTRDQGGSRMRWLGLPPCCPNMSPTAVLQSLALLHLSCPHHPRSPPPGSPVTPGSQSPSNPPCEAPETQLKNDKRVPFLLTGDSAGGQDGVAARQSWGFHQGLPNPPQALGWRLRHGPSHRARCAVCTSYSGLLRGHAGTPVCSRSAERVPWESSLVWKPMPHPRAVREGVLYSFPFDPGDCPSLIHMEGCQLLSCLVWLPDFCWRTSLPCLQWAWFIPGKTACRFEWLGWLRKSLT